MVQCAYIANIAKVVRLFSLILPHGLGEYNHRPTYWGNVSWRACSPASVAMEVWILCYRHCWLKSGYSLF